MVLHTAFFVAILFVCALFLFRVLSDIRSECGQVEDMSSDDEEDVPPKATNQVAEVTVEQPISEEEYRRMLRKHRKRRMRSKVSRSIYHNNML